MTARRLTVDERIELRAALVARGSRLADMGTLPDRLAASKDAVDSLIRSLDDIRVEVTR